MNRALATDTADVLVALNPDTIVPPGALTRLVDELRAHPDVGLVVPRLVHEDGSEQHSVHRFPTLGLAALANLVPAALLPAAVRDRFWLAGSVRAGRTGPIDWAIGAVHVIRGRAVDGPVYNPRWFIYVEDVDLCHRLAHAGWVVWFTSDVTVVHSGGVSAGRAFGPERPARWNNETYDWYALQHGRPAARAYAMVNLLGMALRCLVALVGGQRRRARATARLAGVHARTVILGPPQPAAPVAARQPPGASVAGDEVGGDG